MEIPTKRKKRNKEPDGCEAPRTSTAFVALFGDAHTMPRLQPPLRQQVAAQVDVLHPWRKGSKRWYPFRGCREEKAGTTFLLGGQLIAFCFKLGCFKKRGGQLLN